MVASNLATPRPQQPSCSRSPRRPPPTSTSRSPASIPTPRPGRSPRTAPLPTITTPVDIDGFTEANVGVPYLYPNEVSPGATPTEITSVAELDGRDRRQQRAGPRDHRRQPCRAAATGFVLDASALDAPRADHRRASAWASRSPSRPTSATRSRGISSATTCSIRSTRTPGTPLPSPDGEEARDGGQCAARRHHRRGQHDAGRGTRPGRRRHRRERGREGVWLQPGALGSPGARLTRSA